MRNIIGKRFVFLTFSGTLVLVSILAVTFLGLKQGVDFTGGTVWQLHGNGLDANKIQQIIPNSTVTFQSSDNSYIVRAVEMSEAEHQDRLTKLKESVSSTEELKFETIGPVIGRELKSKALWAFILVLVGISLYIAFAFRKVSKPISSWKYGLITLLTLFHDAIIPTGMVAILGKLFNVEIDTNFIVAILVVMGFSVHDTIVVFDRIRENLRLIGGRVTDFNALVNKSINETLARSINTSLTLVLVLVALYFLGASASSNFILVILVGTIFGTYSSIFVASPLLTLIK